jgi:Zn-dependent protease
VNLQQLLPHLVAAGLILLISFPVHEFSHAYAAYRLGDGTAKLFGRLTLNPVVHFDPAGGFLLLISSLFGFGVGWAKPTPVNPSNLRGGRGSEAIVAAAGPASNLVLAALGAIPLRLLLSAYQSGTDVPVFVLETLLTFVVINVALLLFNFLPIPPLDGSKVAYVLMTPRQQWQWRPMLEQYGFLVLLVVAFLPILPGSETIFSAVFQKIGGPIINLLVGQELF